MEPRKFPSLTHPLLSLNSQYPELGSCVSESSATLTSGRQMTRLLLSGPLADLVETSSLHFCQLNNVWSGSPDSVIWAIPGMQGQREGKVIGFSGCRNLACMKAPSTILPHPPASQQPKHPQCCRPLSHCGQQMAAVNLVGIVRGFKGPSGFCYLFAV